MAVGASRAASRHPLGQIDDFVEKLARLFLVEWPVCQDHYQVVVDAVAVPLPLLLT